MLPGPDGFWHDHVDGSMAVDDIIEELYKLSGKPFPFQSRHMFRAHVRNKSLDIPTRFKPITGILQTTESLEMLGYAYGERRASEGYTYVEGKFAPQYHTFDGLTMQEATDAMIRGLRMAEGEFPITIFPHVCIGREADPEVGIEIAKIAMEYDGEVALDLACDEANNPPEKHLRAYELTFDSNVKRDCHAGEFVHWMRQDPGFKPQLLKNILTAIFDLKCHGIGHAIPLADYEDLVPYVAGEGIRVAGCPLSNLSEGHIGSVAELGIDELLDAGVMYTLNPDDDLFLPQMNEVLDECEKTYEFTSEQAKALEENVFKGAFDVRVRTS